MRHLISGSKLGKQPAHRRAVLRNLVTNLIEKERIQTTILRAKAARPLAEKMITLGKRDSLHARRQAAAFLMTPGATQEALYRSRSSFRRASRRLHAHRPRGLAPWRRRRTCHPRVHRLRAEEERKEAEESRRRSARRERERSSGGEKVRFSHLELAKARLDRLEAGLFSCRS